MHGCVHMDVAPTASHSVINDELQIHTLRHSKHPCAALFNGTLGHGHQSTDDFPFAAFAGDAFEADVSEKISEILVRHHCVRKDFGRPEEKSRS